MNNETHNALSGTIEEVHSWKIENKDFRFNPLDISRCVVDMFLYNCDSNIIYETKE